MLNASKEYESFKEKNSKMTEHSMLPLFIGSIYELKELESKMRDAYSIYIIKLNELKLK